MNYKRLFKNRDKELRKVMDHYSGYFYECNYCEKYYREVVKETKRIKNKELREMLLHVWEMHRLHHGGFHEIWFRMDWKLLQNLK